MRASKSAWLVGLVCDSLAPEFSPSCIVICVQRVLAGNHPVVATNHTLILNWCGISYQQHCTSAYY